MPPAGLADVAVIAGLTSDLGCASGAFSGRSPRGFQGRHQIEVGIETLRESGPAVGPVTSNRFSQPRGRESWAPDADCEASFHAFSVLSEGCLWSPDQDPGAWTAPRVVANLKRSMTKRKIAPGTGSLRIEPSQPAARASGKRRGGDMSAGAHYKRAGTMSATSS